MGEGCVDPRDVTTQGWREDRKPANTSEKWTDEQGGRWAWGAITGVLQWRQMGSPGVAVQWRSQDTGETCWLPPGVSGDPGQVVDSLLGPSLGSRSCLAAVGCS